MSEVLVTKEDIEVTPKMIEAGVLAYVTWDHGEDDPSAIVRDVLRQALGEPFECDLQAS